MEHQAKKLISQRWFSDSGTRWGNAAGDEQTYDEQLNRWVRQNETTWRLGSWNSKERIREERPTCTVRNQDQQREYREYAINYWSSCMSEETTQWCGQEKTENIGRNSGHQCSYRVSLENLMTRAQGKRKAPPRQDRVISHRLSTVPIPLKSDA